MNTGNEQTPMAGRGPVLESEGDPDCSDGLKSILEELKSQEGVRLDAAGMREL